MDTWVDLASGFHAIISLIMATIVADDALADSAGAPIDVDILEIKLTAFP
jgi:hypothetical protein